MEKNYNCPDCNNKLEKVIQSENSPLNKEQFDSVRAGDYFCRICPGTRGKSGFRYYWGYELKN